MNRAEAFKPLSDTERQALPPRGVTHIENVWNPIIPVPPDAPPRTATCYKLGKPSAQWCYLDENGAVLSYVYRWDLEDGRKEIRPLSYWHNETTGRSDWRWKALNSPRPLYALDKLNSNPVGVVIVTEGEKAADAAQALFPGHVATTPPHGAQSPHLADWGPLAGRKLWIWPDNDTAGQKFAKDAAYQAYKAGAGEVLTINPIKFCTLPDGSPRAELPNKWDAADALLDGFTSGSAAELAKAPGFLDRVTPPAEIANTNSNENSLPYGFILNADGVFYKPDDDSDPVRICSRLEVTAMTRNDNAEAHGRMLKFTDPNGVAHQWAMPMKMLAGDGLAMREQLLDMGLYIDHGRKTKELLARYIQSCKPSAIALCVDRVGWHGGAYVLPNEVIGHHETGGRVLLQSEHGTPARLKVSGTPEEWRGNVAALCTGNSRLMLGVSLAFAAPLLGPAEGEPGGFHLIGGSSTGKTTAEFPAASVYGDPGDLIHTWRATSNGLEGVAAQHSDALLCLDEMGQVDGRQAGEIAYMLAGGQGKTRGHRYGGARKALAWRLLFLSTGEVSLSQHMAATGKRAHAGQVLRVADVPADAGAGFGLFEDLHGYQDGAALADAVKAAARQYYGAPLRPYLEMIATDLPAAVEAVKATVSNFLADVLPADADGQVRRIASRFALVAAGGELATTWGFTGWKAEAAAGAARVCFDAWLKQRGGHGPQEERDALAQIRHFLESHGQSRFQEWEPRKDIAGQDMTRTVSNQAGYRKEAPGGIEFYVFPQVFKAELCEGRDPSFVVRLLIERGWLMPSPDGTATRKERLPGIKNKRVYRLTAAALGGEK